MAGTLILSSGNAEKLYLPLSEKYLTFSGEELVGVVYQDESYRYVLEGFCRVEDITDITIIINERQIKTKWRIFNDKNTTKIYIDPLDVFSERPFFLLYGIVEITLIIECGPELEKMLFSPYLAVAVRQESVNNMESIKEMLNDIYKKDYRLLHKEKNYYEKEERLIWQQSEDKFSKEISLLKEILISGKRLLPYFLRNPHTIAIPKWVIDDFEKLHTIQSKNLNYIVTHPEQLRPTCSAGGISVRKERVLPDKTLVSTSRFSCDTVENQSIVSFIYTLISFIKHKRKELEKLLEDIDHIKVRGKVRNKYIVSAVIIQEYTKATIKEQLVAIISLSVQYTSLFHQYIKALPCSYTMLSRIPTPTNYFLEIYHYRQMYEIMSRWFAFNDYSAPTSKQILHFYSADTIYEYFCLLNLYEVLLENGFSESIEQREKFRYNCNDIRYVQTESANTFYFTKNSCKLTLYYQPVIYTDDTVTRNGITLFRTDGKPCTNHSQWYYSPDFLLKKQIGDKVTYCILDAKWRPQKVLLTSGQAGGFQELSYKYVFSIRDENTLESASFFWLLQGKDDGKTTYYHNYGSISKKQRKNFGCSTGIVRLSPKYGRQDLFDILSVFLSN